MVRVKSFVAAASCVLMFTACSTTKNIGIVLTDSDNMTLSKPAEIAELDKEIVSAIEKLPNVKHVPVSGCDYLVSVAKLDNLAQNRALNINYMAISYAITHFKSKSEIHAVSIVPKIDAKSFPSQTLVPQLERFILQTQ